MLRKMKLSKERRDGAERQKLNVSRVCVFCSAVGGVFTSV